MKNDDNILVRFQTTGKIFQYPQPKEEKGKFKAGDIIIIETPQGIELAKVIYLCTDACPKKQKEGSEIGEGFILKKAQKEDLEKLSNLKAEARKLLPQIKNKIIQHSLQMKVIDAELSLDEKKLTIYFSADGRVDFRGLVSDLVKTFHKLIRLQQIGARDEAKIFKGFGKCGRELCCGKFLQNIQSVTADMAQAQQLDHLGAAKLTGVCGKLMCCLTYELEEYEKHIGDYPEIGSTFKSKVGAGKVIGHNIVKQTISILLKDKDNAVIEVNLKGEKV